MTSIRFTATLRRPVSPPSATWLFVVLPKAASAKLPTRGTVAVEGTFAGVAFAALAVPDGQGGHWLKIDRPLRDAAAASPGDKVAFVIAPAGNIAAISSSANPAARPSEISDRRSRTAPSNTLRSPCRPTDAINPLAS